MRWVELDWAYLEDLTSEIVQAVRRWNDELDLRHIAPASSGPQLLDLFGGGIPEAGLGHDALALLPALLEHSRAQNGRFFGYVLGSAEPVGALGDFLASALNQNVTSWRSGPAAATIERALVDQLAGELGCDGFSGSFCGGGSSANLMGLAMARESKCAANEIGARPAVVYASSEVHMSIPKAVALLGLGRESLRVVNVDDRFKLRADLLREAITEDLRAESQPIAVVASAGTVNTGAVDQLDEIASIAREH